MNKKYNILIDLDRLKDVTTGLGQVALFFGEEIANINDPNFHFTYLVPKKFIGFFGNNVSYEKVSFKRRYFKYLCKKYDLWYTIHQDSNFYPANKKTPFILTINDLNFLGEKKPKKAKKRLKKLQKKVDKATLITTISKFTEQEVRENLKTGEKAIQVIYCGVKVEKFDNPKKPTYAPEGDILFSIGVVQEKKNYKVLIDFIENLPEKYKLIIAGNKSGNHSSELESIIKNKHLEKRILLPGKITDEDKYWFYQNCKAVLFPSKFEGMGFPPVEAMRFGKPVFASTYSSIPEISEDKAYYWENFNPKYMSDFFLEKINEFYADKSKPEILKKHSEKFLWKNNVAQYLKLFREVLNV